MNNSTLLELIQEVESQSKFVFLYQSSDLELDKRINATFRDATINEIMDIALKGQKVTYEILDRQILISRADRPGERDFQQSRTIIGIVKDSNGNPLPGVTVVLKGTTHGTITDTNGNYTLADVPSDAVLLITFVGMQPQEIAVANKSAVNVVMEEENIDIEEVVAIGYGTMKRSDLTGSVASVKADQLNTIPAANAMEALSGKIAGVEIGAVTRPGSSPEVRIRGERSINAGNSPVYVVDGIIKSSIADIPVNEIQGIDVLKDAVSTSIYGSRGANGVIIITTKSGKFNQAKPSIEFDSYFGVNLVKLPELMEGDEYISYRRDRARFEAYEGPGWATGATLNDDQTFDAAELTAVEQRLFTDWKDILYKNSTTTHEHNLNIITSGAKTWGRFSVGYRDEEGYYPRSGMKRLSLGVKLEQQIFDFLKLGVNARYSNRIVDDVNPGIMQTSGSTTTYNSLTYLNPLIRCYDDDGNLIENVVNIYANPLLDFVNPYVDRSTEHRLFSVFTISADIFKGLNFTTNFGYQIDNSLGDVFYSKNTTKRYLVRDSEGAYAEKSESLNTEMTWDNIINYSRSFGNGRHDISATAVFSIQKSEDKYFEASGTGLPDESLGNWNMSELKANLSMDSSYEMESFVSAIGRVQYGYDSRYLLNASVRLDGASVLAPGNKWATFPAVSAAWVLSNEAFYRSGFLTKLKLRLSYGSVGNAAIDPYETYAGIQTRKTNFGNTYVTGYMLDGVVNKDLGWEISKTVNLGIDWELLKGRISGYIDAYRTYTTDLLFERSLPLLSGSENIWQNIGETSSTGLEIMVNSVNVDTKNFSWKTDVNFSTNKSKIEKLITKEDMTDDELFIGKHWEVYYNYILDGIWQVAEEEEAKSYSTFSGYQKRRDIAGPDGPGADGSISSIYDRVILGDQHPKWMLYMRNSFSYKNLTLGFAFNGKFGHMIQMSGSGWSSSLPLKILGDYWTPDNPAGKYPLMATSTTNTMDGLWRYRKGDYINVQEISLAYRFKAFGIRDIGISCMASNPFYLYKAAKDCTDPASPNNNWTVWKTYVMKLAVKF